MEPKIKHNVSSLSRGEAKKLKKIRETKQRRVAKQLLQQEMATARKGSNE